MGHDVQVVVSLRLAEYLLAAHAVHGPVPTAVVEKPTGHEAEQTVLDVAVHALATGRPAGQAVQVAQGERPDADHVEPATQGAATTHEPAEK